MHATFVICFHTARIDNLLQTLRMLVSRDRDVVVDSAVELVCQDDCNLLSEDKLEELERLRETFRRSRVTDLDLEEMHLPYMTNVGVENASDRIVVLESDRVLPSGYFAAVLQELRDGVQFSCRTMLNLMGPVPDEFLESGHYSFRSEGRGATPGVKNVWSGNTVITKRDFCESGRMDEFYKGYGWADSDMMMATAAKGLRTVLRDERELHLWHVKSTYCKGEYRDRFVENGLYFCRKWGQTFPDCLREKLTKGKERIL